MFLEQRSRGTLGVWAEPFVELRLPKIFNLRTDPYERADMTSNTYYDWMLDHAFMLVPAQVFVAEHLQTLVEFPPRQEPALLDEIEVVIPADIDESLSFMISTARDVVAAGMEETTMFETPELADAVGEVEGWTFDDSEFDARVDVEAVDLADEGLATDEPGTTAFRVANAVAEAHEMAIIRRNAGVTESWDVLPALPEEEALSGVTPLDAARVGLPGPQETLVVELTEGDYLAVGFIPAGLAGFDITPPAAPTTCTRCGAIRAETSATTCWPAPGGARSLRGDLPRTGTNSVDEPSASAARGRGPGV